MNTEIYTCKNEGHTRTSSALYHIRVHTPNTHIQQPHPIYTSNLQKLGIRI